MPDDKKTIGTIGIDQHGAPVIKEPIFIALSNFKNFKYLDIRKFYQKEEDWLPTKKGITLSKDQIKELITIIENNKEEIDKWFDE